MADDDEPLLSDVSNSEAFRELENLESSNTIPADKVKHLKSKFLTLHDALIKTMANEKSLMSKAKQLNTQLQTERTKVDASAGRSNDERSAVDVLREDAEQAESEAALCRDREQMLQLEVNDLQRQRNEIRQQLEDAEKEQALAIAPTIRALKDEISEFEEDHNKELARRDTAQKELDEAKVRLERLLDEKRMRLEEKAHEESALAKAAGMPEKIKKGSDVVASALKGLKQQEAKMLEKIKDEDSKQNNRSIKLKELTEEHSKMGVALDRARLAMEQKERAVDEIRKDMEREGLEVDQHMADQVKLDMELKQLQSEVKRQADAFSRNQKEKEIATKRYKKMLMGFKQVQATIPQLQTNKDQSGHMLAQIEGERKKQAATLNELKREVDMYMNSYLKEEMNGKEKSTLFQHSYAEVAELEQEVVQLKKEERIRDRTIVELSSQRERASRQAAYKVNKLRETKEQLRVKELIIVDLKKKKKEISQRLRDFQQLYDLVKNQRNKFVNLIQASSQSISEMKEKLKILGNEVEILRGEIMNKDKLLTKAQVEHNAAQVDRNHLQTELNKCAIIFREKQNTVDEQISEIDKLNAIINSYEKEMLRLKKQYETQVELRNYTGITLIDRNDELCILYEKANIQEMVTKQGDVSLQRREDEIRLLRLETQEVMRSVNVTRKLLPQIPLLDQSIASLQQQLLETRKRSEELSEALESPENKQRWRRLEGKIPDKEELTAKINQLEERLNDKKEQLLEKELVLEEVSSLADRLRQQAAEGRTDTLELAKKVNDYQQRIRAITRKMMATVSELSMYQASALKLQSEKHELAGEVNEAGQKLSEGLPPTEDAEREWYRMQREKISMQEAAMVKAAEEEQAAQITRTTAEPRPNAYIPEDMGIPKPYGGYAPFKPTEAGSTMRHIRKPVPREIVI
mmetsp:Transcript_41716/g.50580  ORF Transcript_41716/g.50580 Transcript_41716/m.50580 type:complete len:921 (+) Transcript_41716:130-2892(+)|eukprot:CAMPEP_0197861262 /NCGR_PEP_ID=MMETSP1438-20131217/37181_1 /TAXON_ID=1461541 /ORGANISM="Pterosperma sp., Strain CCMP1384" /LENGTH=920 /DNA_ID=CAMNT_0043478377 /DNA_START=126 /DNA_END=2888 /DNA_ORIENTATION=-